MADRPDPVNEGDRVLAAIAEATEGVEPDPRLADAVERAIGGGDRLSLLAQATAELEPDDGFSAAVMGRLGGSSSGTISSPDPVSTSGPSSLDAVSRTGPAAALVAAFAAAAALLLSLQTQREVDATIVTSVLSVEVGE